MIRRFLKLYYQKKILFHAKKDANMLKNGFRNLQKVPKKVSNKVGIYDV